jgi:hypothetical protein
MSDLSFLPRILLCGDDQEFFSQVGQRPFKIIGHAKLSGKVGKQKFDFKEDAKIFFNDKLQDWNALAEFLHGGEVDYFLFMDFQDFVAFRNYSLKQGFLSPKTVTIEHFKTLPTDFFYDFNAEIRLFDYIKNFPIKSLLDVDGYFARGHVFTKVYNPDMEIDCISEKPLPPIMENIYSHVYKNFAEVGLKRYDAALLIERKPLDFISMFTFLGNFTDTVITFSRIDCELDKYILANLNNFEEVHGTSAETVKWFFVKRHSKPEDFCIYVVTYGDKKIEEPPEGYKIIHAGRALSEDIGYLGDDTGDNISHLNVYLNEITALYWMWKNTTHTVIGLCHYRRFFTEEADSSFAYEKILSKDAALKILERYDIIVSSIGFEMMPQHELIRNDCGADLAKFAEGVIKKHLLKVQPDYLQTFEEVMDLMAIYKCHLLITCRNIFDAYCKWLFSFYLDATNEILKAVNLAELPFSPRRLIAFLAERMLTIWLRKNRLRIKELDFMFVRDV